MLLGRKVCFAATGIRPTWRKIRSPTTDCVLKAITTARIASTTMAGEGEGDFEKLVGITEFANTAFGFQGILKQRYSDFIVREVLLDGSVSYLMDTTSAESESRYFPKNTPAHIENGQSTDLLIDKTIREIGEISGGVFGSGNLLPAASTLASLSASASTTPGAAGASSSDSSSETNLRSFLASCMEKADDCPLYFTACPCADKESRTRVHQVIRTNLTGIVDSEALEVKGAKFIRLVAKHKLKGAGKGNGDPRSRGNQWPKSVPDYLQFTLVKENIDTMSAAGFIARSLKIKTDGIKYAGTKDKRAVTSQKCTVFRRKPSELARLNKNASPPIIRVGDFEYVREPLKLGELRGNRFGIILRDVDKSADCVREACESMQTSGFINYYGLQRFGRGGSKSHEIGVAMLKSEWKRAIAMLFTPREGDKPEIALAKQLFESKDYQGALRALPAQLQSERCVLENLSRHPEDFLGAFNRIAKNPRLICLHAYQSYVWNTVASLRITKYGRKVVEGDLVVVGAAASEVLASDVILDEGNEEVDDENSTEVVAPAAESSSSSPAEDRQKSENSIQRSTGKKGLDIHAVTAADVAASTYTIRDVILPLPGFDILLPTNETGAYYKEILDKDGLSIETFSTCAVTYRASGAYRKLIQLPEDFRWNYFEYSDPNEELISTELHYLRELRLKEKEVRDKDNDKGKEEKVKVPEDVERGKIPLSSSVDAVPFALAASTAMMNDSSSSAGAADSANEGSHCVQVSKLLRGVELKFILPSGTYATMMLREITKQGTDSQFQAQLTAAAAAAAVAAATTVATTATTAMTTAISGKRGSNNNEAESIVGGGAGGGETGGIRVGASVGAGDVDCDEGSQHKKSRLT